jgi:protoporphyrinogen oxidase
VILKKILIIGGGFTGLTAALRLAQQGGYEITLVEKAPELGGLAAGFNIAGTSLEKTYHYLFTTDDYVVRLAEELGLKDALFWAETSNAIFLNGRMHPFTKPLDVLAFSPCSFIGRLRLGFSILYLQRCRNWRPFLKTTAMAWMRKHVGSSAMETVWAPLLKGKFSKLADSVSMAWLWARIHSRANSRREGREQLGYFKGGFHVLTQALERELGRHGVKIRTGTNVEKLSPAEQIAFIHGEKVRYDFCLFTGPSASLAQLLPTGGPWGDYATKLRSIGYLGAICLVFTSPQNLGDFYWVNINEPDAPFVVFINHSRLVGRELYGGRNVYYLGAYLPTNDKTFKLSDDKLAELWFGYLPKMFPKFNAAEVSEQHVFRFPAAQHIVDTEYDTKIPAYQTPLPGVFLANFSQIFPEDRGTNFAVREGEKVAALIREQSFGTTPPPLSPV